MVSHLSIATFGFASSSLPAALIISLILASPPPVDKGNAGATPRHQWTASASASATAEIFTAPLHDDDGVMSTNNVLDVLDSRFTSDSVDEETLDPARTSLHRGLLQTARANASLRASASNNAADENGGGGLRTATGSSESQCYDELILEVPWPDTCSSDDVCTCLRGVPENDDCDGTSCCMQWVYVAGSTLMSGDGNGPASFPFPTGLTANVPNKVLCTVFIECTRCMGAGEGGTQTGCDCTDVQLYKESLETQEDTARAGESIPAHEYIGCYNDDSVRDLENFKGDRNDMTADVCAVLCVDYKFFGTQYSRQCFCGSLDYGTHGQGNACNMNCTGDSSEICGGSWANSVYVNLDYVPIGRGGFGLWMADDISKLTDKNQWAGFNNFLDDGYFVEELVSPAGMIATCPDCSQKLMVSDFQDCYPVYETYAEYGKFTECRVYNNKTAFVPLDFNFYSIIEKRDGPFKRRTQVKNVNGNDNVFKAEKGFLTYREYVDAEEVFTDDRRSTVRTAQMAKHCHVTFKDNTIWYITETQHNQGRRYNDLSFAPGKSGHTSYADHRLLLAKESDPGGAGPILDLCDCTRAAPTANGCGNEECFALGTRTGVRCNNCGGRCSRCWDTGYCTHTMWYTDDAMKSSALLQALKCTLCLWQSESRLSDEYFGSLFAYPGDPLFPRKKQSI